MILRSESPALASTYMCIQTNVRSKEGETRFYPLLLSLTCSRHLVESDPVLPPSLANLMRGGKIKKGGKEGRRRAAAKEEEERRKSSFERIIIKD